MQEWTEIRRRVLVEGASKRSVCRDYGIAHKTLQKILANAEPPGYRQRGERRPPQHQARPLPSGDLRDPGLRCRGAPQAAPHGEPPIESSCCHRQLTRDEWVPGTVEPDVVVLTKGVPRVGGEPRTEVSLGEDDRRSRPGPGQCRRGTGGVQPGLQQERRQDARRPPPRPRPPPRQPLPPPAREGVHVGSRRRRKAERQGETSRGPMRPGILNLGFSLHP